VKNVVRSSRRKGCSVSPMHSDEKFIKPANYVFEAIYGPQVRGQVSVQVQEVLVNKLPQASRLPTFPGSTFSWPSLVGLWSDEWSLNMTDQFFYRLYLLVMPFAVTF
jgi:hypothetical protein